MRLAVLTLSMILLANPWAADAHGTPIAAVGTEPVAASRGQRDPTIEVDVEAIGRLQAAPVAPASAVRTFAPQDPDPALLGILSLGFAGLLSIRRRRD